MTKGTRYPPFVYYQSTPPVHLAIFFVWVYGWVFSCSPRNYPKGWIVQRPNTDTNKEAGTVSTGDYGRYSIAIYRKRRPACVACVCCVVCVFSYSASTVLTGCSVKGRQSYRVAGKKNNFVCVCVRVVFSIDRANRLTNENTSVRVTTTCVYVCVCCYLALRKGVGCVCVFLLPSPLTGRPMNNTWVAGGTQNSVYERTGMPFFLGHFVWLFLSHVFFFLFFSLR